LGSRNQHYKTFTITYTSPDYNTITSGSWGIPPVLPYHVTFTPALNVAYTGTMSILFDQAIYKNTGLITIKVHGGYIFESFDITDSKYTVSGSTLTLSTLASFSLGVTYTILIAPGALTDLTGNSYPGITSEDTWKFISPETPLVVAPYILRNTFSPISGANMKSENNNVFIAFDDSRYLHHDYNNTHTWNVHTHSATIRYAKSEFDVSNDGLQLYHAIYTGVTDSIVVLIKVLIILNTLDHYQYLHLLPEQFGMPYAVIIQVKLS
jgi:hypothetical protein